MFQSFCVVVAGVLLPVCVHLVSSSCIDDRDCPSYEGCCDGGYCSSHCDDDNGAISTAVLIIIVVFAVAFKALFWVAICYCRQRRRRSTGVVFTRFHNNPLQSGQLIARNPTTMVVNTSATNTYPLPTMAFQPGVPNVQVVPVQNFSTTFHNANNGPPPEYSEATQH